MYIRLPKQLAATAHRGNHAHRKMPSRRGAAPSPRLEEPDATVAFKAKMETEQAKQIYKQRSQIAEFPHAWIKERAAVCASSDAEDSKKVWMESIWACLSYNIMRWFCLQRKEAASAAA